MSKETSATYETTPVDIASDLRHNIHQSDTTPDDMHLSLDISAIDAAEFEPDSSSAKANSIFQSTPKGIKIRKLSCLRSECLQTKEELRKRSLELEFFKNELNISKTTVDFLRGKIRELERIVPKGGTAHQTYEVVDMDTDRGIVRVRERGSKAKAQPFFRTNHSRNATFRPGISISNF